jgi:hypothetical protein
VEGWINKNYKKERRDGSIKTIKRRGGMDQ